MGSRRQLPYQLQYGRCICFFNNTVIYKGFFYGIELQAGKAAALFYLIQRFVDDYFFQPAVKITFRCIEGVNASEHFYKSMAQDVGRLMFVDGIAHGNGHSEAVQEPV